MKIERRDEIQCNRKLTKEKADEGLADTPKVRGPEMEKRKGDEREEEREEMVGPRYPSLVQRLARGAGRGRAHFSPASACTKTVA